MGFKKRIVLTSIISGVLPSSYLVLRYSKSAKLKENSQKIILTGFVLAILTYLSTIVLAELLIVPTGIFQLNRLFGYFAVILLFIAVQSLATLAFVYLWERIYGKEAFISTNSLTSRIDRIYFSTFFLLGLLITGFLFYVGPFIFFFTSIYFIPNVYLYSHLKRLLTTRRQIISFTIIFLLVVSLFPVALGLSEHLEFSVVKAVTYAGNYYSILLLYLVLLYIAFDAIKFVLIKFKAIGLAKIQKFEHGRTFFLMFLVLAVLIVFKGISNFNTPRVQKFQIEVPRKSASIKQLKIAMAADFHFSEITNKKFVRRFVNEVNSLKPDIVLLAGDIFESGNSNQNMDFIKNELFRIQSKYGVYAVEGNHGYYNSTNTQEFFNASNITLLRDSVLLIDDSFQLLGRMDRHNHSRDSISGLLMNAKNDLPIIMLDHQPYYNDTDLDRIDLYLSGHTHNGQLFPFNLIVKMIFDLPWGYRKIKNTHFFVTCGAQGWGPQVKTASRSEIMEIDIEFKGK